MLLNTPAGTPDISHHKFTNGTADRSRPVKESYLKVENGQPVLYLRKTSRLSTSTPSLRHRQILKQVNRKPS